MARTRLFFRTIEGKIRLLAAALLLLIALFPSRISDRGTNPPDYQAIYPAHGMGLSLPHLHRTMQGVYAVPTGLPASIDLSADLPPVGDQGQVGSCASWATGYYLRGWYANKDGNYPTGGFAPMSIYSRIVHDYDHGVDNGSTLAQALGEVVVHGVAEHAVYTQGDYDYTDLPTLFEAADAYKFKASGMTELYPVGVDLRSPQQVIMTALAAGEPVVIGFLVYGEYEDYPNIFNPSDVVPAPGMGESPLGGHANIAYGYNAKGLLVRNQWGVQWGKSGDGILSWAYVNQAVEEVAAMQVTPPPIPQPTPVPTVNPNGPDLVPWPNPQPAPLPAALPPGLYKETVIVTDSRGRTRAMTVIAVQRASGGGR